ncbi:hypothetical protein GYMLUDRAFT_233211 [Collybiopsis luxurians FD-317 M1]|uniref:WDR59/RTC1-like RING zinc finger domain-containing protein n=1 Tax=Collybiopsis luxurians FD-317 M1 TaxID=944289 RepID=A0A0D0CD27_9AGAR|nr:hypothetical protein GYMLUDRAFT_233211 [Collybiopsis luxurians FD-317 M1]
MTERIHSHVNHTVRRPSLLSTRRPPQNVDLDSEEDGTNFRKSLQFDMKGLVGDAVGNMSISPWSRDVVLAARRGLFIIDLESPFEVPRFLPQGGTWDVADVQWNPHPSRAEYIVSTSSEKLLIWNLYMTGKTSIEHILHRHYRAVTDINWNPADRDLLSSTGLDSWVWTWDIREPRKPILGLCAFSSPGTQVKWNRQDSHILASSHLDKVHIWDRRKGSLPLKTIEAHSSRIYGIDWSHTEPAEIVTCSLDKTIKVWDSDTKTLKRTIKTGYPVWRARSLPFGRGVLSLAQRGETALEMFSLESQNLNHGLTELPVDSFLGHSDVVKEFVWRKNANNTAFQLITWSKDRTLRFWPVESEVMQKVGYSRSNDFQQQSIAITPTDPPLTSMSFRDPLTFPLIKPNPDTDLNTSTPNPISAPIGHRSILAEVRAGGPPALAYQSQGQTKNRSRNNSNLYPQPYPSLPLDPVDERVSGSASSGMTAMATPGVNVHVVGHVSSGGGGTMSRGAAGGLKSRARVDALSWLSSVKDATGPPTATIPASGSSTVLAAGTDVRPTSDELDGKTRSSSRDKSGSKESKPSDDKEIAAQSVGPSLQDEITSVLSKLPASKVRLEKHDLSLTGSKKQHRTVTLGLQVPWARSESGLRHGASGLGSGATYSYSTQSVFLRVTFTFPREYPQSSDPHIHNVDNGNSLPLGHLPTVSMEYTPLITMKDRAFMLRKLRRIIASLRERQKPCLEACLRFLVFKDESFIDIDGNVAALGLKSGLSGGVTVQDDDSQDDLDSSEEEDMGDDSRDREVTALLLRNNKNLAEPRTCQGSFGPNGELVCFFRAPPRIVRNTIGNVLSQSRSPARSSVEPSHPDRDSASNNNEGTSTECGADAEVAQGHRTSSSPQAFHQSPALLSDAVRRLGLAATDRETAIRSILPPSTSDSRMKVGNDLYGTYGASDVLNSYSYPSQIQNTEIPPALAQSQIVRIMTNLLTHPRLRGRRHSNSLKKSAGLDSIWEGVSGGGASWEESGTASGSRSYTTLALIGGSPRRSEVVIANTTGLVGGDRSVAKDYVFFAASVLAGGKGSVDKVVEGDDSTKNGSTDLVQVCNLNASVAKAHGRYDHERIFRSLGAVLGTAVTAAVALSGEDADRKMYIGPVSRWLGLVKQLIDRLFSDLRAQKDVQMLAMVASIALQLFHTPNSMSAATVSSLSTRPNSALDYFSAIHVYSSKSTPTNSPGHPTRTPLSPPGSGNLPSSPNPLASGLAIGSSRGSWTSLFSTGKQFMAGTLPQSLDNPDLNPALPISPARSPPIPSPSWIAIPLHKSVSEQNRVATSRALRGRWLPESPNRPGWNRSSASPILLTPSTGISKSWNETVPHSKESGVSFSSNGHSRRLTFSQVASAGNTNGKKRKMVFEAAPTLQTKDDLIQFTFSDEDLSLLLQHIHFYAEMLARWELHHKRAELLKSISLHERENSLYEHDIGLVRICTNCSIPLPVDKPGAPCDSCGNLRTTPKCTVCRLSVKGLSVNCLRCFHVTHVSCWKQLSVPICATGCGCACQISGDVVFPKSPYSGITSHSK